MLETFDVRNFKSIKALTLPMRRFMVLVGPNGAGKTNVVHALQLFGDLLDRGTTDSAREQGWDQLIRREKKPARGGLTFTIRLALPEDIVRKSIFGSRKDPHTSIPTVQVEAGLSLGGSVDSDVIAVTREHIFLSSDQGSLRISVQGNEVTVDAGGDPLLWEVVAGRYYRLLASQSGQLRLFDPPQAQSALTELFRNEISIQGEREATFLRLLNWQRSLGPWVRHIRDSCQVRRLRVDVLALRGELPLKESTGSLLGPNGEGLAAAVDRLKSHNREAFARVLSSLQRVYPRIESVRAQRVQPGQLVLFFKERGISEELGQTSVSDGVLHALALLLVLQGETRAGGILAIEEPENALHPWSLQGMIEAAQLPGRRQTIITTHSETVVNSVKDPASLFVVENRDQIGTTVEAALSREAAITTILRESGQKLGDLWMDGTLGGVPRPE